MENQDLKTLLCLCITQYTTMSTKYKTPVNVKLLSRALYIFLCQKGTFKKKQNRKQQIQQGMGELRECIMQ